MTIDTILVVEKDRAALRSLRRHLQDLGHAVVSAPSTDTAIVSAGRLCPDLVLMNHALEGRARAATILRSRFGVPVLSLEGCDMLDFIDDRWAARTDVRDALEIALLSLPDLLKDRAHLSRVLRAVPLVGEDPMRLARAFRALLENAFLAFPDARRQNQVCLTARTDALGRALVEVSDTGSGMSAEVAACAFDPYFTTRAASGAAGLGLNVVNGIVASAGGDLLLETAPGLGTTVRVTLPAG